MSRPADLPSWATAAGAGDIVDPGVPKETAGWDFEESPPYNFVNWFWNLLTLWTIYLDAKVNGTISYGLRPGLLARGQTLAANERMIHEWTNDSSAWQTPAGTNEYIETSALANHQMSVVLNKTKVFERIEGPGDSLRIDSIDLDNERINAVTINVVITGSVSGVVFSENVAGASGRTVDTLIEGSGLPKLDKSEVWTLSISAFPVTAGTDVRIFDFDINATVTTA